MVKELTKNCKQWLWLIPFIAFLLDFFCITYRLSTGIDQGVYQFLHTIQNPVLTQIFKMITFLGSSYCLIGLGIVVAIIQYKKGIFYGIHLGLVHIINNMIKAFIKRPRPNPIYHLVKETNYSFPSGHAMASTIAYCMLDDYLQQTSLPHKNIIHIVMYSLIFLICLSRIYLGVHYFSDVLGGFLFSLSYYLFIKYHYLLNPKHNA